MKEFRKSKDGFFICEECGKLCSKLRGLSRHLHNQHKYISDKEYYDKWVKKENEGICKICGKEAIFRGLQYAYNLGCSKEHMNQWNQIQIKKAVKEKYGVDNVFQLQQTKNSIKQTCLKLYGCEHNHQDINVLHKSFKSGLKIKQFKNTNLWYQGSYELDFLEKFYDKIKGIERAPSIKYQINGNNKIYFPDFYIPTLNLIIECKSLYYYNLHKELVNIKKKATIANGFNYCMILDKNYNDLTF